MNIQKAPRVINLINRSCVIYAEDNVTVSNCEIIGAFYIGFASYINSAFIRPYCQVGRYCSIGRDVSIGLGVHQHDTLSTSPFFEHLIDMPPKIASKEPLRRVIIGNDVWIGDSVKISSGVKIGNGCIIAAGAVVTSNMPPYSIMGGVPAKEIRKRFSPLAIEKLLRINWWDLEPNLLKTIKQHGSIEKYISTLELLTGKSKIFEINYHKLKF